MRELLIVEDNEIERHHIVAAIGNSDTRTTAVGTAAEALEALRSKPFDCMVLDLNLPDGNGLELLETVKRELGPQHLRVVVYTGRDLTSEEKARLDELAETTIVKDARSLEHLVDKTALFLHRIKADVAPVARAGSAESEPSFVGKTVLIVDDDVRNVFALTSKLERWGMIVLRAENGRRALEALRAAPGIDLVLMDIMMPEMDGYETMRAIRGIDRFRELPIIALTAKAMRDDRRKCIEAGASDYIAKPVASDQLLSVLRVWINRQADQTPVLYEREEPSTSTGGDTDVG
jgi:CheY-like chemotaxis protein